MATALQEYTGEDVWYDLYVKRPNGTVVDLNTYPDINIRFMLEESGMAALDLLQGDMTRNPDGSVRIKIGRSAIKRPGRYRAWAVIQDAFGNEEVILDGSQPIQFRRNPLAGA